MKPDTAARALLAGQTENTASAPRGLLAGYAPRAEIAAELGVHERTIARYENMPDGLASVTIGGRKFYRLDDVRAFIEARIKRPQPVRGSRGRAA